MRGTYRLSLSPLQADFAWPAVAEADDYAREAIARPGGLGCASKATWV